MTHLGRSDPLSSRLWSPLMRAGLTNAPIDWLAVLGYPSAFSALPIPQALQPSTIPIEHEIVDITA
jgi:hypothetical protein